MSAEEKPGRAFTNLKDPQLAILIKVSRMYYEKGLKQSEISEQLHLSQSRISRLLKAAEAAGIIQTTVVVPNGFYSDLEETLTIKFGLKDVLITGAEESSGQDALINSLGETAAAYLQTTLSGEERIGISSWSATLLATVDAMPVSRKQLATNVVQLIGGVGRAEVQVRATRLTERLAKVTRAEAYFLPAPGLVGSKEARDTLLNDSYVEDTVSQWSKLDLALVGIGSLTPSTLLRASGNTVAPEEMERLRKMGAVGDVVIRFFDKTGSIIESDIGDRTVGIAPPTYFQIPRRIGVAGGNRKHQAILAALLGGWISVLITDIDTANYLANA